LLAAAGFEAPDELLRTPFAGGKQCFARWSTLVACAVEQQWTSESSGHHKVILPWHMFDPFQGLDQICAWVDQL